MEILQINTDRAFNDWTLNKFISLLPNVRPLTIHFVRRHNIQLDQEYQYPIWLPREIIDHMSGRERNPLSTKYAFQKGTGFEDIALRIVSLSGNFNNEYANYVALKNMPFTEPGWAPYISAIRFIEQPSPESLAAELRWLSGVWTPPGGLFYDNLGIISWPLMSCLSIVKTSEDLIKLATQATDGELGQFSDWLAAEERWRTEGVTERDLIYIIDHPPYDSSIGKIGFPFVGCDLAVPPRQLQSRLALWDLIWDKYATIQEAQTKSWFARFILEVLQFISPKAWNNHVYIRPGQLKELFANSGRSYVYFDMLYEMPLPKHLKDEWLDVLDLLGCQDRNILWFAPRTVPISLIAQAYIEDPNRLGLISFLAPAAIYGIKIEIPEELLVNNRFNTPELRLAAGFMRVVQNKRKAEEIAELTKMIAGLKDPETFEFALYYFNQYSVLGSKAEPLALALLDRLSTLQISTSPILITAMNNIIRTRNSRLGKAPYRKELGLPAWT